MTGIKSGGAREWTCYGETGAGQARFILLAVVTNRLISTSGDLAYVTFTHCIISFKDRAHWRPEVNNFGWVPERALSFFRKGNLLLPRPGGPVGVRMDRVQRKRRLAIRRFDTAIGSAPCTASCARNAGALVLSKLECGSITRRSIEGGCALAAVVVLLHRVFPSPSGSRAQGLRVDGENIHRAELLEANLDRYGDCTGG